MLALQPDVLLLDEPTNHLDVEASHWLAPELRRFKGIGILVSHDRALLDALTTSTLRVDSGNLRLWPGGWSSASEQWKRENESARVAHEKARAQLRRAEQRLQRAKADLEGASANRSTGKRMRNRYDSDARTLAAGFRAEQAEKAMAGKLRAEHQAVAKAQAVHSQTAGARIVGADFSVEWVRAQRPILLSNAERFWGREDRVWVHGPNGAGKTTLLRALADQRREHDAIFFLPQELTTEQIANQREALQALDPAARGKVLQWLAVLGVPPQAVLASGSPSSGEARKMALASALGQPMWGLILDEPTHHLDAPAIERLEAALKEFPGALLLATHDERFAAACTSLEWPV